MVTLDDILQARERLAPHLAPTLLEPALGLGRRVWLKLENTNRTHSFKIRGALNALLALDEHARARGILAASSGNHAQALACAAQLVGAQACIVMPRHTPRRKVAGVRRYGSEAVLFGDTYDEAEVEARRRERAEGMTYVSPYNDPLVIAGAGTIGLELLDALPEMERVLVCAGGGGLVSGIATALKALRPSVEVIAVCAEAAPALYNAFNGTQYPQIWDTLAEALSGEIESDSITIDITRRLVDRVVLAPEPAIADAMRWMLDDQGWLVEGGGAVAVAALRCGVVPDDGRSTVAVVSGANVDPETIRRVIGMGDITYPTTARSITSQM